MRALSVSRAWDESRAILARDGRLFVSVALGLIAFPTLITGILNPRGMTDPSAPLWVSIVSLIASLVALSGQLALIRLALGPSITVGGAINHGMRRMPIYLLAVIMIAIALIVAAVPIALVLAALGVPVTNKTLPDTPPVIVAVILYFLLIVFVFIRMIMSAPLTSAEAIGPIAVIRRSWDLTAGNFWRLLGFMLLFFIAAIVVLFAVHAAVGVAAGLLVGPIEPMSASAVVVALVDALFNAAVTTLLAVMLARMYVQLSGADEQPEMFR